MVKQYIQQSILEKELLYFGYETFGITFVDPVSLPLFARLMLCFYADDVQLYAFAYQDSWTPENVMPQKLRDKQK